MFLRKIDFVSPRITFYYNGSLVHSSIFSGILSLISVLLIPAFSAYFINDSIKKKKFNAFYYLSFIEDAPTLMINSTSLFHFVNLAINGRNRVNAGIDFTVYNIIGTSISYQGQFDLKEINHWLYGICNNTDAEGINHLISYDFFTKSACIKKYFDQNTKKYYDKGDPNFKYPSLSHGSFNDKNSIYNLYIIKCGDNMIGDILGEGSKCKTTEEMNQYFDDLGERKLFQPPPSNNYVNISSYNNPIKNFIYRLDTPLYPKHYTVNFLNINPAKVNTNDGVIYDEVKEEKTYIYERNDAYAIEKENENLYAVFSFSLKNIMNIYERNYSKVYEIISDIGGIFEILLVIASFINRIYNDYIVIYDTSELLKFLIDKEKNLLNNENNNNKEEIKKIINKTNLMIDKEENEKYERNTKKNEEAFIMKPRHLSPISFPPQPKKQLDTNKKIGKKVVKFSNNNEILSNDSLSSDENKKEFSLTKNKDESFSNNVNNENTLMMNKKSNFFYYILYLIACKKKNSYYDIYNNFREKIISEEHLVRNHLNIYHLLRITKESQFKRGNSYKINDLIFQL